MLDKGTSETRAAQCNMGIAMLTVKDAAQRLAVSEQLIYALCAKQQLRHVRVGLGRGTIRIPEDAIEEYVNARTVEAGTASTAEVLTHIRRG
jgi:excisionase family DNA binding protein